MEDQINELEMLPTDEGIACVVTKPNGLYRKSSTRPSACKIQ